MINDDLLRDCAALLKIVFEFKLPTDGLLSKFFRDKRKLTMAERGIIAETIYTILRNYYKLTAQLKADDLNLLIAYTWLHLLNIPKSQLLGLNRLDFNALELLPALDLSIIELPQWLITRLAKSMSLSQVASLAQAMTKPAPLTLRVNVLKMSVKTVFAELSKLGIKATNCQYSPYGIILEKKTDLMRNKLFLDGIVEVQDESSQLAAMLLAVKRNEMVVDFCAGGGGKTLALGMLMKNSGRIYAFDVNQRRLANLSPRLARSGLSNIYPQLIKSETDSKIKRLRGKIDRVFVDAPCLGLGTLRRNPDLKFRYGADKLLSINQQQLSILTAASQLLKPGGRLVYATCSILAEENQQLVAQFLAAHPAYSLVPLNKVLSLPGLNESDNDYLMLNPALHGSDGFFAAVIEKHIAS